MDLGLEGRACIVTGASRGIGRATALLLAAEGARVLLAARGEEALDAAAEECRHAGASAVEALALDATEADAGDRLSARCQERLGPPWAAVCNAGTSRVVALEDLSDDDFEEQWRLSVLASLRLMRSVAPGMAARGGGRIVNVASSSGKRPSLTNVAYTVGKAAQLSLSRAFADAYAASGVLVNAVTPGPIETGLWLGEEGLAEQGARARGTSREQALEAARGKIPIGRMGTAEEVAAVVAFLCSERASNVAGAAWSVDGGSVPVII